MDAVVPAAFESTLSGARHDGIDDEGNEYGSRFEETSLTLYLPLEDDCLNCDGAKVFVWAKAFRGP